ncbi:MAG TPA: hypothetical protein EYQ00_14550 [Dehalococcoidia bacterium]|nr:hypothetical protein [Dehalococcoidia bacterium]
MYECWFHLGPRRHTRKDDGSIGPSSNDESAALLSVSPMALKRAKHVIDNASAAVVDAVEATNQRACVAALDDDEKGITKSYTLGGKQGSR